MTTQDKKAAESDSELESLYLQQRQALNNAYAALQGQQVTDSFYSFGFEDAMDMQIERIEGKGSMQHPNLLDQVAKVKGDMNRAVVELKSLPPEMFMDANVASTVNTPQDG